MNEQLDPTVSHPDNLADARCPLPSCGYPLHITWTATRPVFLGDNIADFQEPDGAYTAGWEISCEEGHVVLLPVASPGSARDVEVFGDGYHEDSPSDLDRLRQLLALGGRDATSNS